METRTVSLDSLFKDGLFDIPSYQRSYSWEKAQLQDLLEDLLYLPSNTTHFFGNIILDQQDEAHRTDRGRRFNVFDVVDGQQRLTSAMIFLQVAAEYDSLVRETLEEDNLIFPVEGRPRLLPQDQDREYFRDCLFSDSEIDTETPSQKRLKFAADYFHEEFAELAEDGTIKSLVERLRYDCRVNVVEIDDDSEAASIFESLNDRGKPLSTLDKTKSFLMYMDDRSSNNGALENVINERFGSIYRKLFVLSTGHERVREFGEESFQRSHWGMFDGYDSDEYFQSFETLKNQLRERYRTGDYDYIQDTIDHYTADLREAAGAFSALFHPADRPDIIQDQLLRLLELGRVANVLPVLMASHLRFGDNEPEKMAKIIDACETLVFRMYAFGGRRSDTGRGRLVRLAHEIHSDSSLESEEIIGQLDQITQYYTSDDRFERALRDPEFYQANSSRDSKYLLYHYGEQLDTEIGEETLDNLPQILSTDFQVEHILARNIDPANIPSDLEEDFEDYVHRIGNLTIASQYWNQSYGNLPFEEKKVATGDREADYSSSTLRVQKVLADNNQFGKQEIEQRQDELVSFACDKWSIEPPQIETPEADHPEEYAGYVPHDFFDRLTQKQEIFLRILWDEDEWIPTDEITRRMENEYEISTHGSSTVAGLLAGLTLKHSKEYRRSIIQAQSAGDQFEWALALDDEQHEAFAEHFRKDF